ncbi:hypothetical protein V7x_00740 [Crateriforma conspicua]|uniref:IrrE N-terminal-like domain-containing protein n=2 Tax=Crateriforma conspicua TaxID=2527996 RepID=A0A5C6FSS4_9PLAN|nr:hypothetical protein V7x_00740 [Crateriforma conspicua]
MARMRSSGPLHEHIQAVVDEMGIDDPREAVRQKARSRLAEMTPYFDSPPFDLLALASCFDLQWSDESPAFSQDSEIVPQEDGRVALRVNQQRPLTRQRFSIAHEIGHTLFPDYQFSVRCRKATERRWTDDDLLESLCDVAASEFMFPLPWFTDSLAAMQWTGDGLAKLADEYQASREATARRVVEVHAEPMAAVYLSWKLKPTELQQVARNARQPSLLDELAPEDPEAKLRVDYVIANESYRSVSGPHIPIYKSMPSKGPMYEASISQSPTTGNLTIEIGRTSEDFQIIAAPIYTEVAELGPDNGNSVVAIIRPANHESKIW